MTSLASCGQKSSLNEKWLFEKKQNLSGNPNFIYKLGHGIDCHFHDDNTFDICFWIYGESIGRQGKPITGTYLYNSSTKEIALTFYEKYREVNTGNNEFILVPTSYYILKGLSCRCFPSVDSDNKDIPSFPKTCLRIMTETKDEIQIELYGYKNNGEKKSFGQQAYIREILDKNND